MGLFSNPKIDENELRECLACFEAESMITAFQTKEADLYNNAMVKYGNSISNNPSAAMEAVKAAKRLVESANEVIRRHNQIRNIPSVASIMHHAWYVTFMANAAWASATAAAIEAMAKGMNPNTTYVQKLVKEYQEAWRRADNEDKKFLQNLKVNAHDISAILMRTQTAASLDNWKPKMAD